jgi:hypothetical protein
MQELTLPTFCELFDRPRPPRLPHPDIPKDDPSPAMEIADRESARLLVNISFFDPPIGDCEIEDHAKRHAISFDESELQLREFRK